MKKVLLPLATLFFSSAVFADTNAEICFKNYAALKKFDTKQITSLSIEGIELIKTQPESLYNMPTTGEDVYSFAARVHQRLQFPYPSYSSTISEKLNGSTKIFALDSSLSTTIIIDGDDKYPYYNNCGKLKTSFKVKENTDESYRVLFPRELNLLPYTDTIKSLSYLAEVSEYNLIPLLTKDITWEQFIVSALPTKDDKSIHSERNVRFTRSYSLNKFTEAIRTTVNSIQVSELKKICIDNSSLCSVNNDKLVLAGTNDTPQILADLNVDECKYSGGENFEQCIKSEIAKYGFGARYAKGSDEYWSVMSDNPFNFIYFGAISPLAYLIVLPIKSTYDINVNDDSEHIERLENLTEIYNYPSIKKLRSILLERKSEMTNKLTSEVLSIFENSIVPNSKLTPNKLEIIKSQTALSLQSQNWFYTFEENHDLSKLRLQLTISLENQLSPEKL